MVDWQAAAPRLLVVAVLVVTNVAVVGAMGTSATPYGPYNGAWDGTSELRTASGVAGADPTLLVDSTGYERFGDGSVAFVVQPQSAYDVGARTRVRQYVRRGGTLVVAAESAAPNGLLDAVGARARIGAGPLRDEQSNYRGPLLAVATNVSAHPLVDGVDALTLNHGRVVEPNNATVLVRTATTAYVDRNENGTFDRNESVNAWPVATVEEVGAGRVVVVGDASVFTNALADREGNRALAERLVAGANATVFDQSHRGPVAPLPYALAVVRTTPSIQFAVGLGAFLVLGFVGAGGSGWLTRRLRDVTSGPREPTPVELTADDVEQYLETRHPDWDEQRVRRVTKAVIRRRGNIEDND